MDVKEIPFSLVNQLSAFDKRYAEYPEFFNQLHVFNPTWQGIEEAILNRLNHSPDREALVEILKNQYADNGITGYDALIDSLRDKKTFVITSAHQPYLFGGPLYFLYKIMSTVKLAHQCKARWPEYNFVPVFYIGGEDHDFNESNHISLFNKEIIWHSEQKGPIGLMSCSDMSDIVTQVCAILGSKPDSVMVADWIKASYSVDKNVNQAITHLIHFIFDDFKVLVFNPMDKKSKVLLKDVIKKDILGNQSEELVIKQQQILIDNHLKPQAYVRPINFFYISEFGRQRIELYNEGYKVVDTPLIFSAREMEDEIEQFPEKFSPNVILRPLYQEIILPSVIFVGGGGEMAYWSDRRLLFEHFKIPMPVLVRRDSFLLIDTHYATKLEKAGLILNDLFLSTHQLSQKILSLQEEGGFDLDQERLELNSFIDAIVQKSNSIDSSLNEFIGARFAGVEKILDQVESKVRKSLMHKHETEINQIIQIQQKLFPNNSLQERTDSLIGNLSRFGTKLIQDIYNASDPLNFTFKYLVI